MSESVAAVRLELLEMRRVGLISAAHWFRCVRYLQKHPEVCGADPARVADELVDTL